MGDYNSIQTNKDVIRTFFTNELYLYLARCIYFLF